MTIRVGYGYDVHRLAENRDFWMGGVKIDHHVGLLGHSDADMRDIGFHFPDTDPKYKGADSKVLLQRTIELIATKGYRVGNVDCTICAERPKLNPHVEAMRKCLAPLMQVDEDAISIKATTSERMGFVGREEGIAAYCVALIEKD